MKSRSDATRKRKLPRWLKVLWGGFNAGALIGIIDGLTVIFFGLARFDRTGEIIGFLTWDALGLGLLGSVCSGIAFFALGPWFRHRPRLVSLFNLVLLFSISSILTVMNIGWSLQTVRGKPPTDAKNILLMTLDTLRSDSTGAGGNPIVRTPCLDRIARQGRYFSNAVCPVPMTTPSHASMLTSTIPAIHGASENRYRLHESNETMTEIFRERGYRTAAFVSCFPLDRRFGLDQGFMLYHDRFGAPGDLRQASWYLVLSRLWSKGRMERNCRWTNSLALPWIRKYTGDGVPFFLWIHYFDPHSPYCPPLTEQRYYLNRIKPMYDRYPDAAAEESAARAVRFTSISPSPGRPEELYLGEITEMDRAVGQVINQLSASDMLNRTIIAILADHGESFGEHGFYYTHGEDIYEPALSIPLMLYAKCDPGISGIDPRLACASDIASTILPAAGIDPAPSMEGVNLLDSTVRRHGALVENYGIIMNSKATKQRGIRMDSFKMILNTEPREPELFNLQEDPQESRNLADAMASVAQDYSNRINDGFSSAESRKRSVSEDLSVETLQKLEALGYVMPSQ